MGTGPSTATAETANAADALIEEQLENQRLDEKLKVLEDLQPESSPTHLTLRACTRLSLSVKGLTHVPDEIALLSELRALNLYDNSLSYLPDALSCLSKLRVLYLGKNRLVSLPVGLSCLVALEELYLDGNIIPAFPEQINGLVGLTLLWVGGNPIQEIPPWITALSGLKELSIEHYGTVYIKRAPSAITNLPCWNNPLKRHRESLRRLQLYTPKEQTPNKKPNTPSEHNHSDRKDKTEMLQPPITIEKEDIAGVDFDKAEILGEGGFGTAYKVHLRDHTVAIKVVKKLASPDSAEYEELTQEAKLMVNLRHTNIIGLYAYGSINRRVIYIMEYADGGSVWDLIKRSGALHFSKTLKYSLDIISGLIYLHSRSPPIEHRDLKPENVLVCGNVAKICDFGLSVARESVSRTTQLAGTFHYIAPEAFDFKAYGPMSDMYTFGLVVWAMLAGERPYDGMTYPQIMSQKLNEKTPEIGPIYPEKLAQLTRECWRLNPRTRPTAEQVEMRLKEIL